MRIEDLGFYPSDGLNPSVTTTTTNPKRNLLFSFISLRQIDNRVLGIIEFIATIYSTLQNIFISFWPHLDLADKTIISKYDYLRSPLPFEENLTNALFFCSTEGSPQTIYIFSFVTFFTTLLFFLISLTSFCLFFFKKRVNFPLIYCFNFFTQFICPIVIVPIGFQTGWLISRISYLNELKSSGNSLENYGSLATFTLLTVLDIILFLILFLMIIVINILDTYSIFIVNSFIVSYNEVFQTIWMVAPSLILLLSNVMPLFHVNFRYLIISLHFLLCISMTVMCFWFPSGKLVVNSMFASLSISMLISDCLCFTSLCTKWYRYMIFIGCSIILFFLMNLFLKLRVKSILKLKDKKDENSIISTYEDLSVSKLLFTLRIAMITKDPVFLDGKLADFISTRVRTNPDKIELSCLICYFPEFRSILFALLMSLKRARFLSPLREFQLFQLRHYEAACHSSTKVDDIDYLVSNTKELSRQIRTLWQMLGTKPHIIRNKFNKKIKKIENQNNFNSNINYNHNHRSSSNNNNNNKQNNNNNNVNNNEDLRVNNSNTLLSDQFLFGTYYSMSQSISHLEDKWKALIYFYPNNVQVAHEYSKFLVECCGDFVKAAEWRTMSILMQDGKTFYYNSVTISFLKAHPEYAKQLMYSKSNFLSIDEIDYHTKLANMEDFIDMPETRFEYQRATNEAYPLSLYIFLLISLISLLFNSIFWIVGINTFNRYQHISDSIKLMESTALLSQQISKNFIAAFMDYGQIPEVDLTPTASELHRCIFGNDNINETDRVDSPDFPSLIELKGEYKHQIFDISEQGMNILHFLHNSTLDQIVLGNSYQSVLDIFFNNSVSNLYYFSNSESKESNENQQSLLMSFFAYFFTFSYQTDFSWIDDPFFYHSCNAGTNVLDKCSNISSAFLENDQVLINQSNSSFSKIVFFVSIVYFIVSVIFMWINFCYIWNAFHKIVYTLQFFPKTVKLKAASPIIISNSNNACMDNSNNNNYIDSNNHNNNVNLDVEDHSDINIHYQIKYTMYVFLIVSSIIYFILSLVIVAYYFVAKTYRNQFVSISKLVHFYSIQTSSTIELLFSVISANMFGQIVPKIDEFYKKRFINTIKKFIINHENCGNISIETDCGITGKYANLIYAAQNQEKCPEMTNKSFHEIISCLGTEQEILTLIDLTDSLLEDLNDSKLLKKDTFMQFIHFILSHVYYDERNYTDYLQAALSDKMNNHVNIMCIFGTLSIVISFFLFLFNINIFYKFKQIFKTLFTFFSRLPPPDLVVQDTVLDAFFGIKLSNKIDDENNESAFLVQESLPICFIDRSTMIELVNSSFTHTFGYEANFIVGQPISILIEDDSILYLIDSMKYFGAHKSVDKTVKCRKGNGNKISFNITFIPIKETKNKDKDNNNNNKDNNSDCFVHRIALVFVDKTAERNAQHKCKVLNDYNNRLVGLIFPDSFRFYVDGCLNDCSVCIIKLQNMFENENQTLRVLTQRQNLYDVLFEKLKVYPLLHSLDCKNGFFIVVGYGSNDPAELAIECLNFVFSIFNEFAIMMPNNSNSSNYSLAIQQSGTLFAVVETAGSIQVGWSGQNNRKVIVSGELIERALKVLDNACLAGNVCVSKKTYEFIMMHDYLFNEKVIEEDICDSRSIFAIDVYPSEKSSFASRDSQSTVNSESSASSSGHQPKLI